VVVTSTLQGATALGAPVRVGVFTEQEALAFLAERTGREDPEGATRPSRLACSQGCWKTAPWRGRRLWMRY
jgi:hypothetical protein